MRITIILLLIAVVMAGCTTTQPQGGQADANRVAQPLSCSFKQAPASLVLESYGHASGKEVLIKAGVHGRMTFEAKGLTHKAYLALLEKRLDRAGIALVRESRNRFIAEWKDPNKSGMQAAAAGKQNGPTKPSTPTK